MAEALLGVIFEKLTDEAFKKYVRSQKIHSELNELKTTLSNIKALLNDASHKEITHESVGLWLNSLQHLAYDIDDVLDDVATEAMHRELTQESGAVTSKVRKLIPTCCTNFSLSHRLSSKIDSITIKLQLLEKQKSDLGLIVKDEKPKSTSRRNETSLPDGSSVVGRESEIEKLLNKLLGDDGSSKENFSILPIVGMGGVGKTTLARHLYNDPQVKGHFKLKAWVCVSDDFDIFKISKIIFQAVSGERREFEDLNQLQMDLTKQLQDKRFLLVIDDVWHENDDDWENLVRPFHSCAHGSRIIMTTRKEELLIKLGFNHLDSLKTLSHVDALSLFARHALGVQNFDSHTTLKPLGEAIVKKCAGLPLALKAIGTLLKARTNEQDCEDVFNSEIWNLENSDKIVPALRLSYHDLSSNLKQLFAYCSLSPKGFLFDEENLVLLWTTEKFFNQSNAAKSPERLGHVYFEILLSRSFFQHAPNDESLFMMHDLMNDLSTFVAGEHFLRFENHMTTETEALEKYRHMSFTREEYVGHQKFEAFKRARSLRTLLAVSVGVGESSKSFYLSNKILVDLLPKLPLLRVLSLSCFEISELPEFIGNLKHLRYLNLSQTKITELPENVGNLYHLQTLIVFCCESLTKLPKSFMKLKKLQHLDLRDTPLLKKMPLGIGELKSLYTLNKIIIGGEDGFAITDLKGFKNLHGIVSIGGLQRVQSVMQAREVNLSLKEITKLELKWIDGSDGSRSGPIEKEVLNMLEPSRDKLKELAIMSYGGKELSNWVGDPSFHKLVNVSIHGCSKCTSLPPFGQLPSLKELFIKGMDEVKVIGSELIGTTTVVSFPSLEILKFQNMSEWKVWSTNNMVLDAVFPCLQELYINDCPNLIDISLKALPSVRVLSIHMCGVNALRSLVQAASLVNELGIASIVGLTNEAWRGVIMYLKAIEKLYIWHCDEISYLWDSEETNKVLLNLKELDVRRCKNLVSLGEKEVDNVESTLLLSLRYLEIFYCESMKHCYCPNSIEYFSIQGCSSLTLVSFPREIGGEQKLKSVTIYDCKKLTKGINNTNMPMLEFLFIGELIDLKSITQFSNFNHLTVLCLSNCTSIESFQLSNLTSLRHLIIINCPSFCLSFDRGFWPPNLVSLDIGGLKEPISEWGPLNFPSSLIDLTLSRDRSVSDFRHLSHLLLSSLTSLKIEIVFKLESLSMGLEHLSSLQHLSIEKCLHMKHLPVTLLPSLLSLRIALCPYLS
ncbi:putative P-loop containing nucleoside triphosphate hydrolase, leucine-rich repeat domain superfamily [Helianthus annuus]|nr:putative P-loop containing nucleoside triphosphate hydrolase, leucine-rich repeat domain superfamily [Helianthus annuus]